MPKKKKTKPGAIDDNAVKRAAKRDKSMKRLIDQLDTGKRRKKKRK